MYFGDTPAAVLVSAQVGNDFVTSVYYIYADHIDTPRVIARSADNAIVWRWDMAGPFGVTQPNENPVGAQTFVYNLRFPGQLFDKETNNHYNYFRDYDPQTGRYVQSDPIGLKGGINTYGYVGANPVSLTDPRGLNPATAAGAGIGTLVLPGPGTVVGAIGTGIGIWIGYELTKPDAASSGPLASRASGEEKLPIVNPGRDCDGNCRPCPPGKKWFVPKPGHGHENGYWHTIVYNQDKKTCTCYPDRPSGGLEGY